MSPPVPPSRRHCMEVKELNAELLPLGCHALHIAALRTSASPLRNLLEHTDESVNVQDIHGRTPLLLALQHGRGECVQLLLERGGMIPGDDAPAILSRFFSRPPFLSVLEAIVTGGRTNLPFTPNELLLEAADEGSERLVRNALSVYGCEANHCDHLGRTALHYACQRGHASCVELLLRHGASLMAVDGQSSTPLHLASSTGHLKIVQLLVDTCKDVSEDSMAQLLNAQTVTGCTPLHVALYKRQYHVATFLFARFQNLLDFSLADSNGHSLPGLTFTLRCRAQRSLGAQLPCLTAQEATWLLHSAISDKDLQLVNFAIAQGADVNCFDFMQHTPLLLASRLGFLEACKVLMAHGANAKATDHHGKGPLYYAAYGDHVDVFAYLFSQRDVVDIISFYHSYQCPLTTHLIRTFLALLENLPSIPKPQDWMKWLCLVTPCSDRDAYKKFVELVCPANWLMKSVDRDMYQAEGMYQTEWDDHASVPVCECQPERVLEVYEPGDPYIHPVDISRMPQRLLMLAKDSEKFHSHCCPSRSVHCSTGPAGFHPAGPVGLVSSRHTSGHRALVQGKRQPFNLPPKPPLQWYPLHEAVLCKNRAACEHFLSCARQANRIQTLLNLKDDFNRTIYELLMEASEFYDSLLQILQLTHYFCQKIELLDWMVVLKFIIVHGQPECSTTNSWPHWCYILKIEQHCRNVGLSKLSLDIGSDRTELFEHLLTLEGIDYDSLLHFAVVHSSEWAITLLLKKGAQITAQYNNKFIFCEAIVHSNFAALNMFLELDFMQFVRLHSDDFYHAFFASLLYPARHGRWDQVLQLLKQAPCPNTTHLVKLSMPLLCASMKAEGGQDVTDFLLHWFISVLCFTVESWTCLGCEEQYSFISLLHNARHALAANFKFIAVQKLVQLCLMNKDTIETIFHLLCGGGFNKQLEIMLESCKWNILCKADQMGMPPYFYAACCGHFEIMELDAVHAAIHSSTSLPLCLGVFLYMALAPQVYYFHQTSFGSGRQSNSIRKSFIAQILQSALSKCSFSSVFKDPALVRSFISIFLPTMGRHTCQLMLFAAEELLFHPLLLISLVPNLEPLQPFLEELYSCLHNSTFNDCKGGALVQNFCLSMEARTLLSPLQAALEDISLSFAKPPTNKDEELFYTPLDIAISFSTQQTCQSGSSVLEDILALYAAHCPLSSVHIAASKGLWKVVDAASHSFLELHKTWGFYTLSNKKLANNFYKALHTALRYGKQKIAKAIYILFLSSMEITDCKQEWRQKLLQLAIKYDLPDEACSLIYEVNHVDLGKMSVHPTMLAAWHGKQDVLDAILHQTLSIGDADWDDIFAGVVFYASRNNQSELIEHLQHHYTHRWKQCWTSDKDLFDSDKVASFWHQVLLGAVEGGHNELALHSLAWFPNMYKDRLHFHPKHLVILHWCAYWGFFDILNCIPYMEEQMYMHYMEGWPSAWEAAIVNGHVGQLCSYVPNFPLLWKDLHVWIQHSLTTGQHSSAEGEKFMGSLLTGSFHRMMAKTVSDPNKQHCDVMIGVKISLRSSSSLFHYGLQHTLFSVMDTCLSTLGNLAGYVLFYLIKELKMSVLHQGHLSKDAPFILECMLQVLSKAGFGAIANDTNAAGDTPLVLATQAGDVASMDSLLKFGPDSMVHHVNTKTGNTLLHHAVMSGSCKALSLICNRLDRDLVTYCFRGNRANVSPLYLAFSMGCTSVAHQLMQMIPCQEERILEVLDIAKWAFGWFRLTMNKNSEHLEVPTRAPHLLLSIRDCHTVMDILKWAVTYGQYSIAFSILEASAGLLLVERNVLKVALLDHHVLRFLHANNWVVDEDLHFVLWTEDICLAIRKGKAQSVIELLKFLIPKQIKLEPQRIYEAACCQNDSNVMQHLMQSKVCDQLPLPVLLRGLSTAAALGNIEVGLFLRDNFGIVFDKEEDTLQLPPLSDLIFCSDLSYDKVLYAFFQSTIHNASLLSTQWLSRKWTTLECQYILQHCGRKSRPISNPWELSTFPGRSIMVHVDWDSFFNALAHLSARIDMAVPFFVEAIILSHAVIGRLWRCISSCLVPASSQICDATFLVLSCSRKPSFQLVELHCVEVAVAYMPDTNMLLFPIELEMCHIEADHGPPSSQTNPPDIIYDPMGP